MGRMKVVNRFLHGDLFVRIAVNVCNIACIPPYSTINEEETP